MLDINLLRENPEIVRDALSRRNMETTIVDELSILDQDRRTLLKEVEDLKAERNRVSKEIGLSKDSSEREKKIIAMREVGDKITLLDDKVRLVDEKLKDGLSGGPKYS